MPNAMIDEVRHPYLPDAPIAVRPVRSVSAAPVGRARAVLPALVANLLLTAGVVAVLWLSSWLAASHPSTLERTGLAVLAIVIIVVTAVLLKRAAQRGRPPLWATMVCLAWGVVAALWLPDVLEALFPNVGWSSGVLAANNVVGSIWVELLVQLVVIVVVLLPALVVPQTLRGLARGFLTGAAAGLGYGSMHVIVVLSGRHLVGAGGKEDVLTLVHLLALPVFQAFVSGWGVALCGHWLNRGPRWLVLGFPVAVLLSWVASLGWDAFFRVHLFCDSAVQGVLCAPTGVTLGGALAAGTLSCAFGVGVALTVTALGRRTALLRESALVGLVQHGWYTPEEALGLAQRPARRRLLAWAGKRGARAQARSVISTADHLIALRLDIEHLADPVPTQLEPRSGVLAEQSNLLQRSLTARESLRTAVADGPGGWTAS